MSNSSKHLDLGKKGEDIALQYLIHSGHVILETNWRSGKGELDIVSTYNNLLVISEVKTRTSAAYGEPFEDVTERKQALLEDTAEAYLEEKELELELRFDIISIVLEPQPQLEHITDAF